MIQACIDGDLPAVRAILKTSPELACRRDSALGSTPMHFAAHRGHTEIVDLLLEAGGDVGAIERCSGTTPLHWAAEGGHPSIVRRLLQAGAIADVIDDWYGLRPVDWTAVPCHAPEFHDDREGAADVLEVSGSRLGLFALAALGLGDRIRDEAAPADLRRRLGPAGHGAQPLHVAIAREQAEAARTLIDMGAPHSSGDGFGRTPLALAEMARMHTVSRALRAAGAGHDLGEALARSDLERAAEIVRADPGCVRTGGVHAGLLSPFVAQDNTEAVRLLLESGADPEVAIACLGVNERITELRPVHQAAMCGALASLQLLLAAGADPDAAEPTDRLTPLHLAAAAGHLQVVRALLQAGADPAVCDGAFEAAPSGWARHGGNREIAELLEDAMGA